MKRFKEVLNYFLIGVLAVIPIFLVIQVVIFIEEIVVKIFEFVYGYSDSYLITLLAFVVTIAVFIHPNFLIELIPQLSSKIIIVI